MKKSVWKTGNVVYFHKSQWEKINCSLCLDTRALNSDLYENYVIQTVSYIFSCSLHSNSRFLTDWTQKVTNTKHYQFYLTISSKMECYTIIILSVLVMILLNVYFWFYCIFCKKNKQCGDIQYFVTVIHKKNKSSSYPLQSILDTDKEKSNNSDNSENCNVSGVFEEVSNCEDVVKYDSDGSGDEDVDDWNSTPDFSLIRPLPAIPEEKEEENVTVTTIADVHTEQPRVDVTSDPLRRPQPIFFGSQEEHVYSILNPDIYTDDMPMPSIMYE